MLKRLLKKILPKPLLSTYHFTLALLAALFYRFPSRRMIVIGVTGTTGKTTTSYLIAQLLELAGFKTGLSSTAIFKVGEKEWLNDKKMTMLGRLQTQKLLRQMVRAGCAYAVIETSSEGILQHRQVGIHYDSLVFTNLSPEHLEAHGGFDNYKKTKLKLFKNLARAKNKVIGGRKIPRTIIANLDSEHAADFLNFKVDQKITYSLNAKLTGVEPQPLLAAEVQSSAAGLNFKINGRNFHSPLLGDFNAYNNLAAVAVLCSQNISLEAAAKLLPETKPCPGRMEIIQAGQPFTVVVDYAFEPKAMANLYQTILKLKPANGKIIHVLGGTGGGRDKARRPVIGGIAGQNADLVIVTNEDPYDEDPAEIINQVAQGVRQKGKVENQTFWKISDRREAIHKALSLAKANDLVLITGKGSEQAIAVKNGKLLPWDDRVVVKEEIKKMAENNF
ncbi:MAG: UDP-N-acetylmuramoyl-L-alanyl-D-glutamate--2,6-diaminopimelate ligase [Patescibacteria group bacterium]|jgi:UDP-N-acetylmuramoyl-L-alanyl-D-glutamate--2,6-diaminopimelate ligase